MTALLRRWLAELFDTDDQYALFGLTSISFAVAGSVAPSLSGAGVEALGSFQPVFVTASVVGVLAAGIFAGTATVLTVEDGRFHGRDLSPTTSRTWCRSRYA